MTYSRRQSITMLASCSMLLLSSGATQADTTPPVYAENGIAIDGIDPVAYFTQNAPVAGSPSITFDWNGATWRFVSDDNRNTFAADPEAYAPQYGGYCAYAVSKNYTAPTVPEAWRIVDGKLYLNYSLRVKRTWERNIPGRIASGDANWPSVLD